jgi:hypothetical protein
VARPLPLVPLGEGRGAGARETDQEVRPQRRLAPRLTEGRGTVGGFLDNRKHNASVLLDHLATRLSCAYGMAETVHRAKFIYSHVAEPPLIDELAER